MASIKITKDRKVLFEIKGDIYVRLFDHTVARRRADYLRSLTSNSIPMGRFLNLCRSAEIPYPLFLAPSNVVKNEINDFEKKVFYGVSKTQLSLATRGDVELGDISLILKDLTRKQGVLKKYIETESPLPGMLKNKKLTITEKAQELWRFTGYNPSSAFSMSKESTFSYLRQLLADKNIYVSLYMHNFCPQQIPASLKLSGICIKDKKCPFIFIRAGDDDSVIEPWGRKLFTLALLLSCMSNAQFGAVSINGRSRDLIDNEQYMLAEELLMPEAGFAKTIVNELDDIRTYANAFSVSPSAMVMRLFRLEKLSNEEKETYLDLLQNEYNKLIAKKGGGKQPPVEKAVSQYNSPRVVKTITDLVSSGAMTENDAKNLLYYKKGDSFSMEGLASYAR